MKKTFIVLYLLIVLVPLVWAATKISDDPTRINVGARPLGMGKAYVAAADDINALFLNPAGLAQLESWQLTSLTGRFLDEVNYYIVGGAFGDEGGVVSLGYTGSTLGFSAPAVTIEGGRVVTTTEVLNYSDYDNILFLAYALGLDNIFGEGIFSQLDFGAEMKLFSKELKAGGSTYAGSGFEMDLGLIYDPGTAVKFGLVAHNVLPATAGGRIVWSTGLIETLPTIVKSGLSVKILGKGGLRRLGRQKLLLNVDGEYYYQQTHIPILLHAGLEWFPYEILALRVGLDQDVIGTGSTYLGVANNLSAGVGLLFDRFRFDYAYHQFTATPGISNHFFALTYGLPLSQKPAELRPKEAVEEKKAPTRFVPSTRMKPVRETIPADVVPEIKPQETRPVVPTRIQAPKPKLSQPTLSTVTLVTMPSTTTTMKIKPQPKAQPQPQPEPTPAEPLAAKVAKALLVVGAGGSILLGLKYIIQWKK